jgi:hypothetical protein
MGEAVTCPEREKRLGVKEESKLFFKEVEN